MEKEETAAVKKCILSLLLALALSASAFAMEIPTDTVVQNLNGSQQLIKTYTLSPDADPQKLIEEPFELEGYAYAFADIVKTENHVADTDRHTETVTLETSTNELAGILEQLLPVMEYDDGLYSGTLSLDHTSIRTEASGYTTKSRKISTTKTIGPVDRNDMSYVPATTVKDGVTLSLSGVDWQIIGTDVVGDSLAPTTYQAVASYSGKTYYQAATGYVTTASVILLPHREAGQPARVYAIILAVDLLDKREGTPRLGPAAVKGKLGRNFHGLLLGDAVGLAQVEVRFQLGIQPRREQRRNGNHAAVTGRELVLP